MIDWYDGRRRETISPKVRRPAILALFAATFVAAGTATGGAAPTRDALIRPGQGIGKVNLGMTLAQARAALGRPDAVVRRFEYAFGGEYVELQWGQAWTVGFRTEAGKLRVVRVATAKTTQRTREGLGIGSRPRAIVGAFPDATCVVRYNGKPFPGTWVVVTHESGRMTAFMIDGNSRYFSPPTHEAIQVLVQERWFSHPSQGVGVCGPDWRRL